MTRRLTIALIALTAWTLTMVAVVETTPASAAGTDFLYKDKFNEGNYGGNNGTHDFMGAWWEVLDWGGPNKGAITIESTGKCPDDRCVRIGGKDAVFWGTGIARRANTLNSAGATAKFKYRLDIHDESGGHLEVAVFDGNKWRAIDSIDLGDGDNRVHTKSYIVAPYQAEHFTIGFFAQGEWDADIYIDNIQIYGQFDVTTTTTTAPPITTQPPTTTVTVPPTTTTTTTKSPSTTTTTTTAPTTTTTTTRPPTVTTAPPPPTPTTTTPPTTTAPPATTVPSSTTRPPSIELPLADDDRYTDKGELAFFFGDIVTTLPSDTDEIPEPSPVTQLLATVTTTAITVRSHLWTTFALGLLIAAAAVFGLGRRDNIAA